VRRINLAKFLAVHAMVGEGFSWGYGIPEKYGSLKKKVIPVIFPVIRNYRGRMGIF